MNRYEEILTRIVVAQIGAGWVPEIAAKSVKLRDAAQILESHFQEREREQRWDGNSPPHSIRTE